MSEINKKIEQAEALLKSAKDEMLLIEKQNKDKLNMDYRLNIIGFLSKLIDEISNEHCALYSINEHNYYKIGYDKSMHLELCSEKFGKIHIDGNNLFKKSWSGRS